MRRPGTTRSVCSVLVNGLGPLPGIDVRRRGRVGKARCDLAGSYRQHREFRLGAKPIQIVGAREVLGEIEGGVALGADGELVDPDQPAPALGQIARPVGR